ncbi:MAG: hypothetical protein LUE10_00335 [Alistipes sp.]|nr:hypothetical protein [Alistipes sp.]
MNTSLKTLLYLTASLVLASGCTGPKAGGYVGRTYGDPKELNLTETFGIQLSYDQLSEEFNREPISLSFMHENPSEQSNEGLHIFLVRHSDDNSARKILAELEVDRTTDDIYDFAMVSFTRDGERITREYLVRTDQGDQTFREIYLIDLKNLTFVPREPYPDMDFLWDVY